MQIKLVINNDADGDDDDLIVVSLDKELSSTISSWLIDYYFTKIYSKQVKISNKSIQPNNIIGLHDMFIIYQIIESSSSSLSAIDFFQLCKKKFENIKDDLILDNYNNYLNRCGLYDIIDLFYQCKLKSFIKTIYLNIDNVKNEIDRLFLDYLVHIALERSIYDETTQITTEETSQNIMKLFDNEKKHVEQTISKNYIKHTLCTYLSLLLDTRNEHALIHCLITPARTGIERRTIVELRRLTKLSKNECLTIYQILLSFVRRKELILNRISSSQQDSQNSNDDESFLILDKYYVGIKEFFDFIEQLQMTIEENEHMKIESSITFRKLLTLISKQLRKDISFNRCELIFKDVIEEFCQCFQTTLPILDCASPTRSASSGGTLAGRRFLRSVAYLYAKQTIHLPIILTNNDHYDSPSTGLRKATSSRLLRSPLTPLPIIIDQKVETPIEEKAVDIPVESVFMWQKKAKEKEVEISKTPLNKKRYRRRKSQRCLDLNTIQESSFDSDSITTDSTDSVPQLSTALLSQPSPAPVSQPSPAPVSQPSPVVVNEKQESETAKPISVSIVNDNDKENPSKRRIIASPPRKKPKKTNAKVQIIGQKMITNFFQLKA